MLIADSNELIIAGLSRIIEENESLEHAGTANSEEELEKAVLQEAPDVILIDHSAPGFSVDVVPRILEKAPRSRFVAITPDRSGLAIQTALRSGIRSYIKKDCSVNEIRNAVIDTAKGKKFFCGKILEALSQEGIDAERIERDILDCEAVSLSERESEIIKLIAEGFTNGQIAEKLYISDHTVTTHRKNIMKKLGVRNTAGIVLYAVKTELVSPNRFHFAIGNKEAPDRVTGTE